MVKRLVLRPATSGRFEVTVNGISIFNKAKTGRLPRKGEISKLLTDQVGAPLDWR